MNLQAQAAYRNLLDEAWLRGGKLPVDNDLLARACGDARRWSRLRPIVMQWFYLGSDGHYHNKTLDEVLKASTKAAQTREQKREQMRHKRAKTGWDQDQDQDQKKLAN